MNTNTLATSRPTKTLLGLKSDHIHDSSSKCLTIHTVIAFVSLSVYYVNGHA